MPAIEWRRESEHLARVHKFLRDKAGRRQGMDFGV
jgi:hypothetical protein